MKKRATLSSIIAIAALALVLPTVQAMPAPSAQAKQDAPAPGMLLAKGHGGGKHRSKKA